jgi:hypothetical protein
MASGHGVPHQQAEHMAATDQPHREENPCQQGAVHTWHFSDVRHSSENDRC